MTDIKQQKRSLRERMLQQRATIPDEARQGASREICRLFMANVPRNPLDKVAGYWPISQEVDDRLLLEMLVEERHICGLPVIEKERKVMQFRQWQRGIELSRAALGTYEPFASMPLLKPTLVIVPLLAFDAAGNRLGFGQGYYDHTLHALNEAHAVFTVGLAYAKQQVGYVPHEAHDYQLDCVVTEERVIICDEGHA